MNTYHVFFDRHKAEVQADTALAARTLGIETLRKLGVRINPKHEHMATPVLVAMGDKSIPFASASLPGS